MILSFMESRGVSGYRLSKDTGISESLFGKWRAHPTSKIDAITVTKIADYFDVSVDFLLGKEQKNNPATQHDEISAEILNLFEKLPIEKRKEILNFTRYQVQQQQE